MNRFLSRWCSRLGLAVVGINVAHTAVAGDDEFSNFLELRIYESLEDQRDRFLEYFEEHFLESQEAFPMRIWGQFRDLNEPIHFVWLRGYRTMEKRLESLQGFYTGEVWRERSPPVGEMLKAARHVHFLEPVREGSGFGTLPDRAESDDRGVVVAEVYLIDDGVDREALLEQIEGDVMSHFEAQGGESLGLFESSDEPNNAPRLPFIEDEHVIVWFSSFASQDEYESARAEFDGPALFETFVLEPGARSRLTHRSE